MCKFLAKIFIWKERFKIFVKHVESFFFFYHFYFSTSKKNFFFFLFWLSFYVMWTLKKFQIFNRILIPNSGNTSGRCPQPWRKLINNLLRWELLIRERPDLRFPFTSLVILNFPFLLSRQINNINFLFTFRLLSLVQFITFTSLILKRRFCVLHSTVV